MIQITADTRRAVVTNKELLTVGSAGIQVQFTLSEDWDTLSKLAVFRVGDDGTKVDVVLGESLTCVVPPEVLTQEDEVLFIGIYGSNGQGTVIIPTVWASAGVVKPGTEPNTPAESQPTPEIWAQILSVANDAEQTATEAMSAVEAGLQDLSTLEGNVETAEAQRVVNEQDRVAAEQQRVLAENNREAAENTRASTETVRVNAETSRVTAEAGRVSAENARVSAEAARVTAEEGRVAAEENREAHYAEYVTTVQGYANAASASATSAAGSATDAASSASSASTSAGQAASSASSASTSASQASNSASSASTSATTASNAATTATTQAGIATTKAGEAAQSATAASGSATAAASAKTDAEAAQAAAEEAAESIEESAAQITQNTQDISDAKNAINYIQVGQKSVLASEIIQGTYNLIGAVVSNANRIRTNGFIDVKKGEKIVFIPSTNVHEIFVGYFSTSGSFIRDGSWLHSLSTDFDNDYKIILVFRRENTTQAIAPSDYDASTIFYTKQDAINKSIENIDETYVVPFRSERSGYLNPDGTIYGNISFSCTDYIAIYGKVMINGNHWYVPSGYYYVACYDLNKSFLGVLIEGNGRQTTVNEFLTLPTGTAFIKVCNYTSQIDSFDVIVFNNISDIAG